MKSLFIVIVSLLFTINAYAEITPVPPVPTADQLAWQEMEFIFFVHFGVNTFTNREWGDGSEDPAIFNPTEFDARQWAQAVKDAGGKMIILTCKHHDGFCLWPSEYTDHSVASSPWKNGQGDLVQEVSDACREFGLKFGVYLSPWDRNYPEYGNSPVYNDYFVNQLTELLTQYGPVDEVWFDGANGEGPNGKRQVYDWQAYYETIRQHQPNAVIAIVGPDVRWVGNESGVARETEWSVQIVDEDNLDEPRNQFNKTLAEGDPKYVIDGLKTMNDVAFAHLSRDKDAVPNPAKMIWYPAETNTSIRPGWFYHPSEDDAVKSLEHLLNIYFSSVGRNTVFLLNIPPDPRGLFHENDVQRLKEFRQYLDFTFKQNLIMNANIDASSSDEQFPVSNLFDDNNETFWTPQDNTESAYITIDLIDPQSYDVIQLREPIQYGQRIAEFSIDVWNGDEWTELVAGTTIGYKRLLRIPTTTAERLRLNISKSRGKPVLSDFSLFKRPSEVAISSDSLSFTDTATITLSVDQEDLPIYYTLDGSEPTESSPIYNEPIIIDRTTKLKAKAGDSYIVTNAQFEKVDLLEPVEQENLNQGLRYTYIEGGWQTLDQTPETSSKKIGMVDELTLEPRERDQHFGFIYEGYIEVPQDGLYIFKLASDDGSRLYIHDQRVIDNDGLHGMAPMTGEIALQAGKHPFRLSYFNATGNMGLRLEYSINRQNSQPVPASLFYHEKQ